MEQKVSVETGTQQVTWLKALTNRLGPAGIVGMTICGPGTISAVLVSAYGWSYDMLWVVLCSCLFATLGMYMTILVTASTGKDAIDVISEKIGRGYVWFLAIIMVVVQFCVLLAEGNALAQVGAALFNKSKGGIFPFDIPFLVLAVGLTVLVVLVYFYRDSFGFVSQVAWALMTFMVVCFLAAMFISKPNLGQVMQGFIPHWPPIFKGNLPPAQAAGAMGGILGGAFGLYTFIYHPFALKEAKWDSPDKIKYAFWDNFWASGVIYGLFCLSIFITFATILYPLGKPVVGIGGAAAALQPLLGRFAYIIFVLGWFAAVFTTTAGAAMIGWTPISKVLGFNPTMKDKKFRMGLAVYTLIGAAIVGPALGQDAFKFLTWAMSLLSITAPIGVGTWLYLGNKKDIMGDLKFKPVLNTLGVVMFVIVTWIAWRVIVAFLG